jgi:hypothetical protein
MSQLPVNNDCVGEIGKIMHACLGEKVKKMEEGS